MSDFPKRFKGGKYWSTGLKNPWKTFYQSLITVLHENLSITGLRPRVISVVPKTDELLACFDQGDCTHDYSIYSDCGDDKESVDPDGCRERDPKNLLKWNQ